MPVQSSIFLAPTWRKEHLDQQRGSHISQGLQPISPLQQPDRGLQGILGKADSQFSIWECSKSTGKVGDDTALDRGSGLKTLESFTTLKVHKDQSGT